MAMKGRMLFLSPSVLSGEERECKASDFENLDRKPLGEGSFGSVYRVRHKATGKLYAIKLMVKRDIVANEALPLVRREIRIMYSLNHPYVIKLHNHFEDDRYFYLILELAEGGSLFKHASKTRGLDERQVAQIMREVATGVHYLHHKDPPVIHRDIKPENILLDADNTAKLGDFGWSNFYTQEQRQTLCGTPEYLAPEMITKTGHSTSLDLWNLGILMYEMLAGYSPFRARSGDELYAKILKNKLEFPKNFPLGAKDLVKMLLRSDPSERISIEGLLTHPWMRSQAPIRPTVPISDTTEALPLENDECTAPERPTIAFKPEEFSVIGNIDADQPASEAQKKQLRVLEASIGLKTNCIEGVRTNTQQITEFLRTSEHSKDLELYTMNLEAISKTVTSKRNKLQELSNLLEQREAQADELQSRFYQVKEELRALYTHRSLMTSQRSGVKRETIGLETAQSLQMYEVALIAVHLKVTSGAVLDADFRELLGQVKARQLRAKDTLTEQVESLRGRLILKEKELADTEIAGLEHVIADSVQRLLR
jgi:serine/threonine protein kinase